MHVTTFVIHRSSSSTHWTEQNLSVCERIVKYNKMNYLNSFLETKIHAPQRDSNPRSQHSSGYRTTRQAARPPDRPNVSLFRIKM